MAATVSVSKGVFSFKKTNSKKRKDVCRVSTCDYWGEGEGKETEEHTYMNYVRCWQIVTNILDDLQDSIHAKVFQELIEFIRNAGKNNNMQSSSEMGGKFLKGQGDIPTACLVTGVNMPDHDAIFGSIVRLLVDGVTPHIAQLRSRDCSTIRVAVYKMISQLMGQNVVADPELADDIIDQPSIRRGQCNMAVLTSWYKGLRSETGHEKLPKLRGSPRKVVESPHKAKASPNKCRESPRKSRECSLKSGGPPRKKMKLREEPCLPRKGSHSPLVVILEDVESFPADVLRDLILICREYCCDLPIIFVFGIATTPAAVHQSLSQDALACVAMETFQAQPSTHYLNHIIEKVLMSEKVPFHIGNRPFKLLLDNFLYNDLSIKNFIKGFKLCMIEHFMGNSSTFLCCCKLERTSRIRAMTPSQLDVIRKLPSFRTYVESRPLKEQAALLLNEKVSKSTVLTLMTHLESWYARFCCLVKVANALTSTLPHSPLGRQVREVLTTCLSQPLAETEEFKDALKLLQLLARDELLPILTNVLDILQEESDVDEVLLEFYNKLAVILGRLKSLDQVDQVIDDSPLDEMPLNIQATDRFHLKEKLLELAKKKCKRPNIYESLRSEVLQIMVNEFEQHLQPPSKQPLHEIVFFDSSSTVKRHLVGMPRAAVTTALSNPHHYLQCECCHLDDPSSIITTLPDISVAYKLHLECGRLINLYDWLQAFISVVDPEEDTSNKKTIDKKLQARFVQAVSELQFLGFVKPTHRKTDHVARLTWGGC
ncbi:origin recognition complex subunit 3 [Panulirus ornatus]|uniref:origin recognition complex subunit 3 n=1 Tax=Panulirus ornatus TaxID=150431 RepID=UPI003A8682B5